MLKLLLVAILLSSVLTTTPPASGQAFTTRWYLEMIIRYESVKDPVTGINVYTDRHIRIEQLQSDSGAWTMQVWWHGGLVYDANYVTQEVYRDDPGGWHGYIRQEVKRIQRGGK